MLAEAIKAPMGAGLIEGQAPVNTMLMSSGGRPGTVPGRAPALELFGDPAAADNMPRGARAYR